MVNIDYQNTQLRIKITHFTAERREHYTFINAINERQYSSGKPVRAEMIACRMMQCRSRK